MAAAGGGGAGGAGRGGQHSVRRLSGSGQVQCTSWRNFAPFPSSTFKTIHGEQAGKRDRGGSAVGARHIVREHATTQTVLNKDIKRAQSQTAIRPAVAGLKELQASEEKDERAALQLGAQRLAETRICKIHLQIHCSTRPRAHAVHAHLLSEHAQPPDTAAVQLQNWVPSH